MTTAEEKAEKKAIADKMLADIIALRPKFKERRDEAKEIRKVPQASIDELKDIGFFLALQPKRWGGYELDPQDFFRMQIAIAEGCMSTAWASGIISIHSLQVALMDLRAQEQVWSDSIHTRISSAYAPMGKVEKVEGGFMFSGRWGWSSGSDHCTYALLGGIVPGEDYRTFLIPKGDYVIEDTWHAMGLQGTGSNDIVIKEPVFVPDYMTHKRMDGFLCQNPGQEHNPAPLYTIPWAQSFIRVVCTGAIGSCKTALDLYMKRIQGAASSDPTKLAGDPEVLSRIARAANTIDEVEAILYRNFDEMMDYAERGEEIPIINRSKYRYQASLVIDKCLSVIDSLFAVAGGSSVLNNHEMQTMFLDIHTARAHVANNPTGFERSYGSVLLGLENKDQFI